MDKEFIYLDNAATTKVSDAVYNEMKPYIKDEFGNPSSIYSIAHKAANSINQARLKAAKAIGANESEIYFTSSGTESDNWAIKSTARALKRKGKTHLITTNIEHHAVLNSFKSLEKEGFDVTYLKVDKEGLIDKKQVEEAIRENTALVSIMYVNNEIGTIQPIDEIGKVCRQKGVYFHTDAVQAIGHVEIDLSELNVDMLSISGHKIHGPKGVGLLYIRRGVLIDNYMDGGGQERGKRAGTENVSAIVGFSKALEEITKNIKEREEKIRKMRDTLLDGILKSIPKTRLNGSLKNRVSSNINVSFEGVEGEGILLMLDNYGICASSGSACTSGSLDPSHVLLALGLPHEIAHGSLRLTIDEDNKMEEMEYTLDILKTTIEKLRAMSPIWNG